MTYQTLKQSLSAFQARIFSDSQQPNPSDTQFGDYPLILPRIHGRESSQHLKGKRALDIVLSSTALCLLLPLFLVVALSIKLTSPGPVMFKQERIGINRRRRYRRAWEDGPSSDRRMRERRILINYGKPFTIYKFRTMVKDAENGTPVWTSKDDPRITPVGKVLRRMRIDEFPQFFNVLKGDMSIVGPRPERAFFIGQTEEEIPEFKLRLCTKPGITGLAQIELGYTNDTEGLKKKLLFDLAYIRELGLLTDLRILMRTIFVVLTGKGSC